MTLELRLWILAGLCFAAFWALGIALNHAPSLWRIDMEAAAAVRGQATSLAIVFTTSGRALPLLGIAVAAIAIAAATRMNLLVASAIFVAQLLSQGIVEPREARVPARAS